MPALMRDLLDMCKQVLSKAGGVCMCRHVQGARHSAPEGD